VVEIDTHLATVSRVIDNHPDTPPRRS
jgi:hypothetical protein